ncbi:MAG: D-alanine--D-alanine ligase [Helicobacteraceae bacterium]|jgi:D-alanine-D-alanine ligase|nr:D-alanine--D-alanine ligase [Helicobacteraceae bacterium]
MKIEIITTPNALLAETGFGSIIACNSVLAATQDAGYQCKITICDSLTDLEAVVLRKPELVILAVKSLPEEENKEICLSEYFSEHSLNFSGSTMDSMRFDTDKVLAKTHLKSRGISTANFFISVPGEHRRENHLPISFPLFLKPANIANGDGIDDDSLVRSYPAFESKVASLYEQFGFPVLVEEYVEGPAFTVCIIKTASGELLISPLEIIPHLSFTGPRVLGEEIKQDQARGLKKVEDDTMKKQLVKLAVDVFIELDIRDFGRIDFVTNKNGHCFFMEADLVPGMNKESSYFTKAFEIEHELSYESVCQLIVEEGLSRVPKISPLNNPILADKTPGRQAGLNRNL